MFLNKSKHSAQRAAGRVMAAMQSRHQHGQASGPPGAAGPGPGSATTPRTRPTQGELVAAAAAACAPLSVPLVDIGANLVDASFGKDRADVLRRAKSAGNVAAIIVTGTCVRTSKAAASLCDEFAAGDFHLYFTAGVHPHNAKVRMRATVSCELRSLR